MIRTVALREGRLSWPGLLAGTTVGLLLTAPAFADCIVLTNGPANAIAAAARWPSVQSDAGPPGGVWRVEQSTETPPTFFLDDTPIELEPVEVVFDDTDDSGGYVGIYRIPEDAIEGQLFSVARGGPNDRRQPLMVTGAIPATQSSWTIPQPAVVAWGGDIRRDGPEPCIDTFPPPPGDVWTAIVSFTRPKKKHPFANINFRFDNGTDWVVHDDATEGYVIDGWWLPWLPGEAPTYSATTRTLVAVNPTAFSLGGGPDLSFGVAGPGTFVLGIQAVDVRTGQRSDIVEVPVTIPEPHIVQACGCRATTVPNEGPPWGVLLGLLGIAVGLRRRGSSSTSAQPLPRTLQDRR